MEEEGGEEVFVLQLRMGGREVGERLVGDGTKGERGEGAGKRTTSSM